MSFEQTVLLSAFAGATIFIGLPVGRLRNLSIRAQVMLTTAAAGVILFLIWDILSQAVEPVEAALDAARTGEKPVADFVVAAGILAVSLSAGLLSIVWLTRRLRPTPGSTVLPREIALGTAVGLGLHNLSEGLAIGGSATRSRATSASPGPGDQLRLHNATEGVQDRGSARLRRSRRGASWA